MKQQKDWTNTEIAELLRDVAAAYQIQNPTQNHFKIVAYDRAADAIEHLTSELKNIWEENKLDEVPGIGPSIAKSLDELFKTGESKHFHDLLKDLPPFIFELMKLKGVGPKTAYRLVTELKILSLKELETNIKQNKIANLEGFGAQSQEDILKAMTEFKVAKPIRFSIAYAETVAQEIIHWMTQDKNILKIDALGSLRRKVATVGDIDIAVATNNPLETLSHFTKYPHSSRTLEKGEHSASILLANNLQIDLLVQPSKAYGSLLQHFTGSKHHNVALRDYSLKKGMSLSEYGIKQNGELTTYATEEKFYNALGLDWIPPELREDAGEIKAAQNHTLPKLVEVDDIKGDLQIHSDFDIETSHDVGASSMEEIITTANSLGYEYLAFTEHNPSKSKHNAKQIIDLLKRKKTKIEKINSSLNSRVKKVFNSLEIDIMPDGSLPVNHEGLEILDFALVSIHSSFDLSKEKMTERILRAFDNPKVKIFAHPSARLINKRDSINVDWPKIFEAAVAKDIWIEINAEPSRLDLPDILVHEALKYGVKFTMGTDSHHIDSLHNMKYGVYVARRGWCEKKDIINCLSLADLESVL